MLAYRLSSTEALCIESYERIKSVSNESNEYGVNYQ